MATDDPPIGCSGNDVLHSDQERPDVGTRFRMVKEARVFDRYDTSPPMREVKAYLRASARSIVPIRATGFVSWLGRDKPQRERNQRVAAQCAALVHHVQLLTRHGKGHPLSGLEVADPYRRACDPGGSSASTAASRSPSPWGRSMSGGSSGWPGGSRPGACRSS